MKEYDVPLTAGGILKTKEVAEHETTLIGKNLLLLIKVNLKRAFGQIAGSPVPVKVAYPPFTEIVELIAFPI